MLARILAFSVILISTVTVGHAATVTRSFDGVVSDVSGLRLTEGIAGRVALGSPVRIDVRIEINEPFVTVFDRSDFEISVTFVPFGPNVANALFQPCCIFGEDTDPTDGDIGVDGGLGGFVGSAETDIVDYYFSASVADISFRTLALPAPAPFVTADDAAAFLNDPSIVVNGYVSGIYYPFPYDPMSAVPVIPQGFAFTTSVPAVPLPAGLWLLLTGMAGFGIARRRRT